jgi:hypothetical protein
MVEAGRDMFRNFNNDGHGQAVRDVGTLPTTPGRTSAPAT